MGVTWCSRIAASCRGLWAASWRWLRSSPTPNGRARLGGDAAACRAVARPAGAGEVPDVLQLARDPASDGVLPDHLTDPGEARVTGALVHGQRQVERLRGLVDVEWIYGEGPLPQLGIGAGVLRKDQDPIALVDHHPLLGHQVHAVV